MTKTRQQPWVSGPAEILKHGIDLLKEDSDTKRRLAMISIDNAVELMVKTYLGLPKRVTGLVIGKKEFQEVSDSFPMLLNALEKYAADKLDGINLGEIEWYHRLRNELYHQGNGLTVEREKVEIYAELANILFKNLFGVSLLDPKEDTAKLLRDFLQTWVAFEKYISIVGRFWSDYTVELPLDAIQFLHDQSLIISSELAEIDHIREVRNKIIHGDISYEAVIHPHMSKRLLEIVKEISARKEKVTAEANK